jgi:hypothetical protein
VSAGLESNRNRNTNVLWFLTITSLIFLFISRSLYVLKFLLKMLYEKMFNYISERKTVLNMHYLFTFSLGIHASVSTVRCHAIMTSTETKTPFMYLCWLNLHSNYFQNFADNLFFPCELISVNIQSAFFLFLKVSCQHLHVPIFIFDQSKFSFDKVHVKVSVIAWV